MIDYVPNWFVDFRKGYIKKYIRLIIYCYNEIKDEKFSRILLEEERRYHLGQSMIKNKEKLNNLMIDNLSAVSNEGKLIELSNEYKFDYLYLTEHGREKKSNINLYHILLNFNS